MEALKYERMGQMIAIACVPRTASIISELDVKKNALVVSFSNYVRSQVHLNIVSDLCRRTIHRYVVTNRYLNGEYGFQVPVEADEVLRLFYWDMSQFLINNPTMLELSVEVDGFSDRETIDVDMGAVKNEIIDVIDGVSTGKTNVMSLQDFKYAKIIDSAVNTEDIKQRISSYAAAAVLAYEAKQTNVRKIRLRWK